MKVLKLGDGGKGFAFTITQTYFFVLLICGVLAFMFTGWFLYHNGREFPSLVKIIRFHAVRSASDNDLENGRNDQWEMDTAYWEEDGQAGSGYSNTTTEDEYDPYDGRYLCNEDHRHDWTCEKDWNRYGNERKAEYDDWPAYVEVVDNEGKGDNVPEEDEQDPDNWCHFCREYHAHDWSCSNNEDEDQHDWSRSVNRDEDLHNWSRSVNRDEDKCDWSHSTTEGDALRLTPSSSGSDAEANTSTARPAAIDNWYAAPDDTESCGSCDSDYTKDIPWTRPAAHREPLTPTSPAAPLAPFASDADADAENTDAHPKRRLDPNRKRGNGRDMRDRRESEISQRCQSDECRCKRPSRVQPYRKPLNRGRYGDGEIAMMFWADRPGYVAGVEDNDDSEESDISDGATIGRQEGGDSETRNNEERDLSHGAIPVQGFQIERENTGPLNDMQELSDQTTSAQEQRQRPTGTAFSPPDLPARHPRLANILTDERGHGQGPPVGEFRHGITRPLRLIIPTESFGNAEPRAPTTPVNTHSLGEWPIVANTRDDGW